MSLVPSGPDALAVIHTRVTGVPRLGGWDSLDAASRRAENRGRVLPALIAASWAGSAIVVGYVRTRVAGPVELVVGGGIARTLSGGHSAYPTGGISRDTTISRAFATWRSMSADLDPRFADDTIAATLDQHLAVLGPSEFAVLVHAIPLEQAELGAHLDWLDLEIARSDASGARGAQRENHEWLIERFGWMTRERTVGLWNASVMIGGPDEDAAAVLSGIMCASADARDVGVVFDRATQHADDRTVVSSSALASLVPPATRELPGIRVVDAQPFDLTPEQSGPIKLGAVLSASTAESGPLSVSTRTLNRHAFVCGATGSGKSQTVRHMLEQLADADVPWMVIEPAKSEYAGMAGRLAGRSDVLVIRPGDSMSLPVCLNPLEPSSVVNGAERATFPLQTHLDLVRALFTAAFEATDPFPQILAQALTRCYENLGWNLALDRPARDDLGEPRYPTLSDLRATALDVVDRVGYGGDVRDNVRGFVDVRINSLRRGTPGRFFEGGHRLDLEDLMKRNVVFEIEDIGDDLDKAFFIGNLVIRIVELLRLRSSGFVGEELRHVLVIEEAHRLLRRSVEGSPSAHAVDLFANLLAEVRSYGEGLVIAEQIPSKIVEDVVKNSALKVMHRLPAEADRQFVGGTMNLDEEQQRYVVALKPGWAAVHADGMDRPVLVAVDGSNQVSEALRPSPVPAYMVPRACCDVGCAMAPCSLPMLESATEISNHLEVRLYVELACLAALMAEPRLVPDEAFRDEIRGPLQRAARHLSGTVVDGKVRSRVLRCAIGIAVDRSVGTRYRQLAHWFDPDEFAKSLADDVFAAIRGNPLPIASQNWAVVQYRWKPVIQALGDSVHAGATQGLHPATAAWASEGFSFGGRDMIEQLASAKERAVAEDRIFGRIAPLRGAPALLDEISAEWWGPEAGAMPPVAERVEAAILVHAVLQPMAKPASLVFGGPAVERTEP